MTAMIGQLGLSLTLVMAAVAVFCCVASLRFRSLAWQRAASASVVLIFGLFSLAGVMLLVALINSDFRLQYVVHYSERALPLGYKVAALWAGQAGSLLLWGWLLALVSAIAVLGLRRLGRVERTVAIGTLAVVCGFFGAILVFAASPFELNPGNVPLDGRGLNPMLQDLAMIAHPPVLFAGYAIFAVPFAALVGVLAAGRTDDQWLAAIRRWLLAAWCFLSAGIVIGAWWAYVELGWGGYWAWDPVENASLLPWLTSTALLHSMMVQQHRGMFKRWNVSLIAASFVLCIFGTYITRSGVIDSVHAFGRSTLGTFFLFFMIACVVTVFALAIWRRRTLRPAHTLDAMISREGAFLLADILLTLMVISTLVGTMFPLISGLFSGSSLSVGTTYYNRLVAPMALVVVALMATGPVLAFGRNAPRRILRDLTVPAIIAGVVLIGVAAFVTLNPWALLCAGITTLGTFAVITAFSRDTRARHKSTGEALPMAGLRIIDRDHRRYGGQFAHLGLMLITIGVISSSLFKSYDVLRLKPGETQAAAGKSFTLVSFDQVRAANYTAAQATVRTTASSGATRTLRPQRRFYDTWPDEANSEVAIQTSWRGDDYVSLAGWEPNGSLVAIEVRVNPGVVWIWIGGIVMAIGGIFCVLPPMLPLSQRIGAPAGARRSAARGADASVAVPASATEEAMV